MSKLHAAFCRRRHSLAVAEPRRLESGLQNVARAAPNAGAANAGGLSRTRAARAAGASPSHA
eukprot:8024891-Lingulodinium_polyedra.AAC.1